MWCCRWSFNHRWTLRVWTRKVSFRLKWLVSQTQLTFTSSFLLLRLVTSGEKLPVPSSRRSPGGCRSAHVGRRVLILFLSRCVCLGSPAFLGWSTFSGQWEAEFEPKAEKGPLYSLKVNTRQAAALSSLRLNAHPTVLLCPKHFLVLEAFVLQERRVS